MESAIEQELTRLSAGKYLSLTTFRRDGTPVATPVWVTREGGHLYVITGGESGKAKRLRHTSRVQLAPCDMRGTVTGPAVEGEARILDAAGTQEVIERMRRKYGLTFLLLSTMEKLRRRAGDRVGLELTPTP